MSEKSKGETKSSPNHGVVKSTQIKPPTQTPRDSISPPPSATPAPKDNSSKASR